MLAIERPESMDCSVAGAWRQGALQFSPSAGMIQPVGALRIIERRAPYSERRDVDDRWRMAPHHTARRHGPTRQTSRRHDRLQALCATHWDLWSDPSSPTLRRVQSDVTELT